MLIDHRGYVKLADFGLAKENVDSVSGAKSICGTPEYISPEVLSGKGYGKCLDYWSLGCLIYEFLESRPPFYDTNRKVMFNKMLNV